MHGDQIPISYYRICQAQKQMNDSEIPMPGYNNRQGNASEYQSQL